MGATDTAAFPVPIAIVLMVAIVALSCIYTRMMDKGRLRKRQQIGFGDLPLPSSYRNCKEELIMGLRTQEFIQPPGLALTRTVRQPGRDSLGLTIPPYSSADVQPLSPRELELVVRMS